MSEVRLFTNGQVIQHHQVNLHDIHVGKGRITPGDQDTKYSMPTLELKLDLPVKDLGFTETFEVFLDARDLNRIKEMVWPDNEKNTKTT